MKDIIDIIREDPKAFVLDCIAGICAFATIVILYILAACIV